MSSFTATVRWDGDARPFTVETYGRDHAWTTGSGVVVPASAAPDYRGSSDRVNPEEAFVGALASCHMLTFLAVAARRGLGVRSYEDAAIGVLAKNASGRTAMTRVELRPKVVFDGVAPDAAALAALHARAHDACFIAQSVACEVVVVPQD
jgi:organic hydroperoxide reductase OsmC/OhrA